MNWIAVLDFMGLILTTIGAVLLAFPTLNDIIMRRDLAGASSWSKGAKADTPGVYEVRAATNTIEQSGMLRLPKNQNQARWGVALIVVGLVIAIPAKWEALWIHA